MNVLSKYTLISILFVAIIAGGLSLFLSNSHSEFRNGDSSKQPSRNPENLSTMEPQKKSQNVPAGKTEPNTRINQKKTDNSTHGTSSSSTKQSKENKGKYRDELKRTLQFIRGDVSYKQQLKRLYQRLEKNDPQEVNNAIATLGSMLDDILEKEKFDNEDIKQIRNRILSRVNETSNRKIDLAVISALVKTPGWDLDFQRVIDYMFQFSSDSLFRKFLETYRFQTASRSIKGNRVSGELQRMVDFRVGESKLKRRNILYDQKHRVRDLLYYFRDNSNSDNLRKAINKEIKKVEKEITELE